MQMLHIMMLCTYFLLALAAKLLVAPFHCTSVLRLAGTSVDTRYPVNKGRNAAQIAINKKNGA
ncbi:hypothetical protein Scep_019174 [Stephania cephalantha]|uniref:Uncharacterized protein n=1 Tax=Stephania cephalantha TaxID=152367 RepID=A0AAP0NN00_9MAGN